MRAKLYKILVTGGAGFIGSAFVRLAVKKGYRVAVVDKLTYAGDLARLKEISGQHKFYKMDIADKPKIEGVIKKELPEVIVNFAAETHVDRSIQDADSFIYTNVRGTQVLLDAAKKYKIKKFIHISSDEVYGDIERGEFSEDAPLKPSNPYSASKAAADLLIKAYIRTYNFPAIIIRPSNNYGPWQYPEKLIPLSVLKILRNEKIPVYGHGRNVREWLYVGDCAEGILEIINKAKIQEVYNLGSNRETRNIDMVKAILKLLITRKGADLIEFVKDRPGHDIRYKLNTRKLRRETGWHAKTNLDKGLRITLVWCVGHRQWLLGKWKDIDKLYKQRA